MPPRLGPSEVSSGAAPVSEALKTELSRRQTLGARELDEAAVNPKNESLLRTRLIGTALAALCCFTPVLVILLGAVGMSVLVGWLDFVLLPVLTVFVGITIHALWRRRRVT